MLFCFSLEYDMQVSQGFCFVHYFVLALESTFRTNDCLFIMVTVFLW